MAPSRLYMAMMVMEMLLHLPSPLVIEGHFYGRQACLQLYETFSLRRIGVFSNKDSRWGDLGFSHVQGVPLVIHD